MTFKEKPGKNEELGHSHDKPEVDKNLRKGPATERPNDPNKGPESPIGLAGGQPKEEGGMDISAYTGPDSQSSAQFEHPDEVDRTGPGNGTAADPKSLSKEKPH